MGIGSFSALAIFGLRPNFSTAFLYADEVGLLLDDIITPFISKVLLVESNDHLTNKKPHNDLIT